jgi:hypothetical protein
VTMENAHPSWDDRSLPVLHGPPHHIFLSTRSCQLILFLSCVFSVSNYPWSSDADETAREPTRMTLSASAACCSTAEYGIRRGGEWSPRAGPNSAAGFPLSDCRPRRRLLSSTSSNPPNPIAPNPPKRAPEHHGLHGRCSFGGRGRGRRDLLPASGQGHGGRAALSSSRRTSPRRKAMGTLRHPAQVLRSLAVTAAGTGGVRAPPTAPPPATPTGPSAPLRQLRPLPIRPLSHRPHSVGGQPLRETQGEARLTLDGAIQPPWARIDLNPLLREL